MRFNASEGVIGLYIKIFMRCTCTLVFKNICAIFGYLQLCDKVKILYYIVDYALKIR